jgi:hypothetical protein
MMKRFILGILLAANIGLMYAECEYLVKIPVHKGYEAVDRELTAHDFVLLGCEDGTYLYMDDIQSNIMIVTGDGGVITAITYEKTDLSKKEEKAFFQSLCDEATKLYGKPHMKDKTAKDTYFVWFFADYMFGISKEKGIVSITWISNSSK